MGNRLDVLVGRNSKGSKLKTLVNHTISRLDVLKNERQARCVNAISDVVLVLQDSQQQRALIRVEQVVRERNTLDAFAIIYGYCILLSEKILLIEQEKKCPEDLKEAISSLIFAASRCSSGDFPELQRLRSYFASRYGKEFMLRAIELRNNCGVSPTLVQKLSIRQPSLESRIDVLKEIADKNGISLELEEAPSTPVKGRTKNGEDNNSKDVPEEIKEVESFCMSLNRGKQFRDAVEAAQVAFLSAAYAAAAARAALKLSTTSSSPYHFIHPNHNRQGKVLINMSNEIKPSSEMMIEQAKHWWVQHRNDSCNDFDYNQGIDADDEGTSTYDEATSIEDDTRSISSGSLTQDERNQKLDHSGDEIKSETSNSFTDKQVWGKKDTNLPCYSHNPSSRKDNEEQMSTKPSWPLSVRTRKSKT